MFSKFLEDNAGKSIWVATPAGIFSGDSKIVKEECFILENVEYSFGNSNQLISSATIINDSVFAWGLNATSLHGGIHL